MDLLLATAGLLLCEELTFFNWKSNGVYFSFPLVSTLCSLLPAGHHLLANLNPEWSDHYIPYNNLKKCLRALKLVIDANPSGKEDLFDGTNRWLTALPFL